MVGNRNHPLNQPHYDEHTLEEFVLGQLLPDEEARVRQHIDNCPLCQATVADLRALCQHISLDLKRDLEQATPDSTLSFDRIAETWHRPLRLNIFYKLQQFIPGASYVVLIVLLVVAFGVLFYSPQRAALRSLDLITNYEGPPAIIAAVTDEGLVVVKFANGTSDVLNFWPAIRQVRNLKLSPNGQWLAFQHRRMLTIVQTSHSQVKVRVTVQESADWTWSPDSQQLAYTNGRGQLALFDVAAQINRVLVPASEAAWGLPVWTDDSRQLAYAIADPLPTVDSPQRRQSIWRIDLATGYRVELARNPAPHTSLLLPADWCADQYTLLVWDRQASVTGQPPALFRVDARDHTLTMVQGHSLAQGANLAWPVNAQDVTLVRRDNQLNTVGLPSEHTMTTIPEQIPWPQMLDWSPNGSWMAYTILGAAEGQGIYLYAPQEAALRAIQFPEGASEKAVYWAGSEHLFVIRHPTDTFISELWLVSLATHEAPRRLMTNLDLPQTGRYNGWSWQDVIAAQALAS